MGEADGSAAGSRHLHALREHPEMLTAQLAALDSFGQLADVLGDALQSADVSKDQGGRVAQLLGSGRLGLGDRLLDLGPLQ